MIDYAALFDAFFKAFFDQVLPAASALFIAFLAKTVLPALSAWVERFGVRVSAETRLHLEAEMRTFAVQAIAAAEEQFEAEYKNKVIEQGVKGAKKLEYAIAMLVHGKLKMREPEAKLLVQSTLSTMNLGATATSDHL
jgi:hypothetical protein